MFRITIDYRAGSSERRSFVWYAKNADQDALTDALEALTRSVGGVSVRLITVSIIREEK